MSKRFLLVAGFVDSVLQFRGDLLSAIAGKGYAIHVAVPLSNSNAEAADKIRSMGYHVHPMPLNRVGLNPVSDLKYFLSLCRIIRMIQPDAVLAYTVKPVVYGVLAARLMSRAKRFALITGLGYAFLGGEGASIKRRLVSRLVRMLYSVSLSNATPVFFQNPDDQKLFLDQKITRPSLESSVVSGSGVDVSKYGLARFPNKTSFLMIARLLGDKGVREYSAAARIIKEKYPEVEFSLAGWIDDNPNSISQAELERWVSDGTIKYLGRLRDVRDSIAECLVYVLPSYREGTPRTVLEAMSMGRAIITTDAPGCRETVKHGVNGFLIPVQDSLELAGAMEKFVLEPDLAKRFGGESRIYAETKYDVKIVNEVMLQRMGV